MTRSLDRITETRFHRREYRPRAAIRSCSILIDLSHETRGTGRTEPDGADGLTRDPLRDKGSGVRAHQTDGPGRFPMTAMMLVLVFRLV